MAKTIKDLVNNPIIQEQYKIQISLYNLTEKNLKSSLNLISNYLKKDEDRINEIIKLIARIAETKYDTIDIYIKLLKSISLKSHILKDEIQNCLNILFNNDFLFFCQKLIKENFISQKQYDKNLSDNKKKYIDFPNYEFPHTKLEKNDYPFIRKISEIFDNDNEIELKKILAERPKDKNYIFSSIPHLNKNIQEISLIKYAAFRGSEKCFKYLVNNNAKISNNTSDDDEDKINIASCGVCGGNSNIIEILKKKGMEIKKSDILYTIRFHRIYLFDYIVKKFGVNNDDKETLIFECISNNFLHGLIYFKNLPLKVCFYPDSPYRENLKFKNFISSGNLELLKVALKLKIYTSKDFITKEGYISKLDYVCEIGDKNMFLYLYSTFSKNIKIELIFDHIIDSRNLDFINYIFENFKIDKNARDVHGYTPFHRAIFLNDNDIIDYLFNKKGIDLFTINDFGDNLLDTAIEKGCSKIIKFLIDLPDYPINRETDSYEINPLGHAISKCDVETVKLLLNHPKIIPCIYTFHNAQNCEIKTNHILLAIKCGNQKIMELLLSHPLIEITEKEKKDILKKYPKISKKILNSVKMRKENKYDKADEILSAEDSYFNDDEENCEESDNIDDKDSNDNKKVEMEENKKNNKDNLGKKRERGEKKKKIKKKKKK